MRERTVLLCTHVMQEVACRADASTMDLAQDALLEIPGHLSKDGRPLVHPYSSVTPGFLEMMEVPLASGRGFTDADGAGAPPVAMVNEAFARRYFPESEGRPAPPPWCPF